MSGIYGKLTNADKPLRKLGSRHAIGSALAVQLEALAETGRHIRRAGRRRDIHTHPSRCNRISESASGGIRGRQRVERRNVAPLGQRGGALRQRDRLVGIPQRRFGGGGPNPRYPSKRRREI